jgi:hypothetical protein
VGTGSTYASTALANNDTVKCVMTSSASCVTGSPATSNSIIASVNVCSVTINLKAFLEGFYIHGADSMAAVIDAVTYPTLTDTLELLLADSANKDVTFSSFGVLNTHGQGTFTFTGLVPQHRYYIVFRHRSAIETWSKYSFLFTAATMSYDFTRP